MLAWWIPVCCTKACVAEKCCQIYHPSGVVCLTVHEMFFCQATIFKLKFLYN